MEKEVLTYINGNPIYRNFIQNLPYNPDLKHRSKNLRKAGNYPEVVFWQQVRSGSFYQLDFDRQRIIGNYIVDFYIKALGLIIEIDGSSHNDKDVYDDLREQYLMSFKLKIYRISSLRILHDLNNVMIEFENYIVDAYSNKGLTTPPFGHPSKGGE
ncbi:endonuclease domain-containing protein [Flavobacterium subsaxonicum]|uniref:endonuclease domain-containing protein n=1 Tax=Flavobacterium subsaxonicum TaxID=426226 RepID=UPI000686BBE4|nr:DUF559 domain-containing protein [Flavobacterium subsaxonicum]